MAATLGTSYGGPCGAGLKAGADLSADQCKWARLNAGTVLLANAQGQRSIGLIGDAPKAGEGVELIAEPGRTVSVLVGVGGVVQDGEVTTDALGCSEPALTGDWVLALALSTATVGARVTVLMVAPYLKA